MNTLAICAVAAIAVGCGNDMNVVQPDPVTVSGSYALQRVDGHDLPFAVLDIGAYKISIATGSLTLNADSSYQWVVGLRVDDSGNVRFDADTIVVAGLFRTVRWR